MALARSHQPAPMGDRMSDFRTVAQGLGWFSLALGAFEIAVPDALRRGTGLTGPKGLVPAYGLREIGAGLAILASDRPVRMVWGRVAGDALDIATLIPALRPENPHRAGAVAALGFVLAATALDVAVAVLGEDD